MKRLLVLLAAFATVALLGGCAHPISLNADMSTLIGSGKDKIDKSVGLHISAADRQREVIGPGGGGDKVSYFPYRDLETGIYVALVETFTKVSKVDGPADPKVAAEGLHYIISPTLTTTSDSPSLFTWPPTSFGIDMVCKVVDAQGKVVTEVRVKVEGRAEFEEFKSDFSLAAKRAAQDVLKQLVAALQAAKDKLR